MWFYSFDFDFFFDISQVASFSFIHSLSECVSVKYEYSSSLTNSKCKKWSNQQTNQLYYHHQDNDNFVITKKKKKINTPRNYKTDLTLSKTKTICVDIAIGYIFYSKFIWDVFVFQRKKYLTKKKNLIHLFNR